MTILHAELTDGDQPWDEVEEDDGRSPLRSARRTSVQEWGVDEFWDTVVIGPAFLDRPLTNDDRCEHCAHRLLDHSEPLGCTVRVATRFYEPWVTPPKRPHCSCTHFTLTVRERLRS